MPSNEKKIGVLKAIITRVVKFYSKLNAPLRVVIIPTLITIFTILLRQTEADSGFLYLALFVLAALVLVQNALSYLDGESARSAAERGRNFQTVVENLNILVRKKEEALREPLIRHKNNPNKAVFHASNNLSLENSLLKINECLYNTIIDYVRQRSSGQRTDITCSLVRVAGGELRPIHIKSAFDIDAARVRLSKIRVDDGISFASYLWNADSTHILSGPTQRLGELGRFTVFETGGASQIRSIMGYRIDIDMEPRMMWLIDSSEEDSLPNSEEKKDQARIDHLNRVFATFSTRVKCELAFDEARTLFNDKVATEIFRG